MQILKVSGTHFQCGQQIGEQLRTKIQKEIIGNRSNPVSGITWKETLNQAKLYWDATQKSYPTILDEINGVATGAQVDPIELFTYLVEELWGQSAQEAKACTDIVVTPPFTNGKVIVGHNNDLPISLKDIICPVEWNFTDGSSMFTVGPLGFYISCGVNSFGVALTGNELVPNDNKIGVPRAIIARAILSAKTLDEAISIATDKNRASSYNNIIITKAGAVDIESSATAFEIIKPTQGYIIHTNHYLCSSMLQFDGQKDTESSLNRYKSIIAEVNSRTGQVLDEPDVINILSSHNSQEGSDNTICRHSQVYPTLFSIIINFDTHLVKLADGYPCQNTFEIVWTIPNQ